jgi:hypothetical protein
MAAKVYGNKSRVAFVPEVTWGTAVTPPTSFVEIVAPESARFVRPKTFIPTGNTRSVRHQVNGKQDTPIGFQTYLSYTGDDLLLLKHLLGSLSTGAANGDGQYTHTISLAETLPPGLTMYFDRNSAVYGKEHQYPGVVLNKFTIEQALSDVARITYEGMGDGRENEVNATASSFPTLLLADWLDLASPGVLTLNGAAVPCDNISISFEQAMAADVYIMTQAYRADLKADGERTVTLSFDVFIEATDPLYVLWKADTEFAAVATWSGPVIAGSSYNSFSVSCPKVQITDFQGFNGGAGGPIKGKVTMRAYASASLNDEISIIVKNANATLG